MKIKANQTGMGAVEVLLILVVVGIVGFAGWFVWHGQQATNKTLDNTNTTSGQSTNLNPKSGTTAPNTSTAAAYHDYRSNGDATGVKIMKASDVDKLVGAGEKLKMYLQQKVSTNHTFIIDRTDGNFAVGSDSTVSAYLLWGVGASGNIEQLAGTQQGGMACTTLKANNVPKELVDSSCFNSATSAEVTYP